MRDERLGHAAHPVIAALTATAASPATPARRPTLPLLMQPSPARGAGRASRTGGAAARLDDVTALLPTSPGTCRRMPGHRRRRGRLATTIRNRARLRARSPGISAVTSRPSPGSRTRAPASAIDTAGDDSSRRGSARAGPGPPTCRQADRRRSRAAAGSVAPSSEPPTSLIASARHRRDRCSSRRRWLVRPLGDDGRSRRTTRCDEVEFRFQSTGPARAADHEVGLGRQLSRVMLAVEVALWGADASVPTYASMGFGAMRRLGELGHRGPARPGWPRCTGGRRDPPCPEVAASPTGICS